MPSGDASQVTAEMDLVDAALALDLRLDLNADQATWRDGELPDLDLQLWR